MVHVNSLDSNSAGRWACAPWLRIFRALTLGLTGIYTLQNKK
ncbi:hypothetical protein VITFI_CDS3463 (plasmid) [Vitreoscilla filiformis]|uniref:Uncharacterized protein n=1 Tax=Vitreoscilla filiformis TaxID=63 RepID=A0A221KK83_VITFI|nr:hypothetical protein VITFI_CDS3463 [Vitreoscilla filiformis]